MKCEKCGKNTATTHIHTVINGHVTDMNLCGYCAANSGLDRFEHLGLMNLLASVFDDNALNPDTEEKEIRCPGCGSTFADIAGSGLLGCEECYTTFYRQLMPTLNRIHGRSPHVGKIPQSSAPRLSPTSRVEQLKKRLDRAVAAENFELAATLRDEIRSIEGGNAQ